MGGADPGGAARVISFSVFLNPYQMQVIGKLEEVHDVVKRTETFSVREFVLEIAQKQVKEAGYNEFMVAVNSQNANAIQFSER